MKREGEVEQGHSETALEVPGMLAKSAPRVIEREIVALWRRVLTI